MRKGNWSRRGFLQHSAAALTLGAGLPMWFARELVAEDQEREARDRRRVAANDTVTMGLIGCGGQGTGDMKAAVGHKGVKCVAVCDVDANRRDKAASDFGGAKAYHDFRELLARDDIDAVIIGTPDHWHTIPAIAAMKAGKDVYCEKPLTLTIAEGQALVRVARSTGKVLQTGSQQRSDDRFRLACELVRNGRIGKVQTVETRIGDNPKKGPFPTSPVPEGLDWDFWLGQTPEVEYVKERCHYEFRWWYEYSGGKMTDWGAHHNDIAQWGLGADGTGPVGIDSEGSEPIDEPNSYNTHPNFKVTYTYGDDVGQYGRGAKVLCTSGGENGVRFEGEGGWIFVNRGKIEASEAKLLEEKLADDAVRLYVSRDHMGNFLECLRTREKPICDVEIGHRSVSVCHLGVISLRMGGRKLVWDPDREHFVGDALANLMLSRPMRAPWKLEA
ncbi:MAG TPA: Gfo/Idh/MocA family oxidoreductase [Isosphaeraceae bacterium]